MPVSNRDPNPKWQRHCDGRQSTPTVATVDCLTRLLLFATMAWENVIDDVGKGKSHEL
jgi:hypothetical protein